MLFKPEMIDAILAGRKTMTRRVVKDGDVQFGYLLDGKEVATCVMTNGRFKWHVGRSYAIQPGRGKGGIFARLTFSGQYEWQTTQPGGNGGAQWKPMRIRVTAIRCEPLHAITESDAQAEGVESVAAYQALWENINGVGSWGVGDVWVIEFELVEGGDSAT
jgi:hypothetical protein